MSAHGVPGRIRCLTCTLASARLTLWGGFFFFWSPFALLSYSAVIGLHVRQPTYCMTLPISVTENVVHDAWKRLGSVSSATVGVAEQAVYESQRRRGPLSLVVSGSAMEIVGQHHIAGFEGVPSTCVPADNVVIKDEQPRARELTNE